MVEYISKKRRILMYHRELVDERATYNLQINS